MDTIHSRSFCNSFYLHACYTITDKQTLDFLDIDLQKVFSFTKQILTNKHKN